MAVPIDRYWFGGCRFISGSTTYAHVYERVPLAGTWELKWTSPTTMESQQSWCVCLPDTRDGDYFGVLFAGNSALINPLRLYEGTFAGGLTLHELPSTIYGRGIYVGGPDNILVWAVAYPANRGTLYHWNGSSFSVVLDLGPQGYGGYGTFLDGQNGVVVCTPNSHSSSNPVYVNTDGDLGNPSSWVSIGIPVAGRACDVHVTKAVSATEFEIHAGPQTGDPWGPSGYRWYTPGGESWAGYSRFYYGGTSVSSKAYARRSDTELYAHVEVPPGIARYDAGVWNDRWTPATSGVGLLHGRHLADIDCTVFGGHHDVALKSFIAERRWGVDSGWQAYVDSVFPSGGDIRTAYKITTGDALNPPLLTPVLPLNGDAAVSPEGTITFTLEDNSQIVDGWQVEIQRSAGHEWETAFVHLESPQFKAGWQGPASLLSGVSPSYTLTLDPLTPFERGAVVQVRVTAVDNEGHPVELA